MGRTWIGPLIVLVLAVASIQDGIRLIIVNAKTLGARESGGYLILLGILLAGLAVAYLLQLRAAGTAPGEGGEARASVRAALLSFVLLLAYTFAMGYLGYLLSTALFLAVCFRVFGSYRLVPTVVSSVAIAAGSAYFWATLGMMLPGGFIPWP